LHIVNICLRLWITGRTAAASDVHAETSGWAS